MRKQETTEPVSASVGPRSNDMSQKGSIVVDTLLQ